MLWTIRKSRTTGSDDFSEAILVVLDRGERFHGLRAVAEIGTVFFYRVDSNPSTALWTSEMGA